METVISIIIFFLPAATANAAPVIAAKIPVLKKYNYPIDFNVYYKNKRILGDHKTIRGLIAGVVVAITTSLLIYYLGLYQFVNEVTLNWDNIIYISVLLGTGAIFGDLVKSFFKRRLKIKPGAIFFPFDQVDFIIGAGLFVSIVVDLPFLWYIAFLIIGVVAHILSNIGAYLLGIKEVPY